MFKYSKSGKGVINGDWYVYFITLDKEEKIMGFYNTDTKAKEEAIRLNDLVMGFIGQLLRNR